MTVVDTRRAGGARRTPEAGPAPRPPVADNRAALTVPGRRPRAPGAALVAFVVGCVGVAIGAGVGAPAGLPALAALLAAGPIAAGVVARGRPLRQLVLVLPLAFLAVLALGSVAEILLGGAVLTGRTVLLTTAEVAVLHAPWIWGGTGLGLLVALRRGLLARR